MSTLRLRLAATVMMALLVGVGGAALAQMDDDAPAAPALVTSTEDCYDGAGLADIYRPGYTLSYHAWFSCNVMSSDARVTGPSSGDAWQACFPGTGCVYWGNYEIQGPDGSWVGPWRGADDANLGTRIYQVVLEGTAAYEGWTYIHHTTVEPGGSGRSESSGMLYEGPPPPWEPSAE